MFRQNLIERGAENLPVNAAAKLGERVRELTGFRLEEETPQPYAKSVKLPMSMAQLRRDVLIRGSMSMTDTRPRSDILL